MSGEFEWDVVVKWTVGAELGPAQPQLVVYLFILDESCWTNKDCMRDGKLCDGLMDYSCICKKGQCKISCMIPLLCYIHDMILCSP